MTEMKKVPAIRFNKFADDWVESELDSLFSKIKNAFVGTATPYYVNEGHFYLESNNVKNGHINRNNEVFINDYFYKKQQDNLLHAGDIVMVQSGHVGHSAVIPSELNNTAAHALIIFADKKRELCSYFLNYQFQTDISKKEIASFTTGNTIRHILSSDMKKFKVLLPGVTEQTQIGSYLQYLDKLISLHQAKVNKLTNLKKAMLEKMFPKDGADVPEIRFKAFAGTWEKKRLGDVVECYSGGTPLVEVSDFYGGKIPFIRSAEINSNSTELYLTEKGLKNSSAKLVDIGNVLYALYGATSGEVGRARFCGAINQAILSIIPNANYDAEFIMQLLKRLKLKIIGTYLQGGQGNLSGAIIKDLNILFPSFNEQVKLGNYFQNLDKIITLHQTELEKLNNLKKACLEKMFV